METNYTVKNFRRFDREGANVRFSPITILTGANSSGKSSIVKSLVLFQDFIEEVFKHFKQHGKFAPYNYHLNFNDNKLGLGRYMAAMNRNASTHGEKMSFEYSVKSKLLSEEIFIEYSFVFNSKDMLDNGMVSEVVIRDAARNVMIKIEYSLLNGVPDPSLKELNFSLIESAFMKFITYSAYCSCCLKLLIIDDRIEKQVSKTEKYVEQKEQLVKQIASIKDMVYFPKSYSDKQGYTEWIEHKNLFSERWPYKEDILEYINGVLNYGTLLPNYRSSISSSERCIENKCSSVFDLLLSDCLTDLGIAGFENTVLPEAFEASLDMELKLGRFINESPYKYAYKDFEFFQTFLKEVFKEIFASSQIKYIGSSRIALKRLYMLDDNSNDFGNLFKQYLESDMEPAFYHTLIQYVPGYFMQKWLRKFDIADRISISNNKDVQGIEVRLFSSPDDKEGHLLADEGYGITQIIALLLNIEVSILTAPTYEFGKVSGEYVENLNKNSKNTNREVQFKPRTLTIEEPEVHLHPKYQSMLADMFLEAYKSYNIHFIIETHSEYLIRKSQVLVARMGFKTNEEADDKSPFRTIYVPNEGKPYNLYYRKDGKFAESFDPGFFDEASRLMFEIL